MSKEFKFILSDKQWSEKLHCFLQVIFRLYPEDKFHHLIKATTEAKTTDKEIYNIVQQNLPNIKPFMSELTYSLPSLKKQKKEMAAQVLQLLGRKKNINGYLEIGSTGRYISELRKHINLTGETYITNDTAPSNTIADIFERGQLSKLGRFIPLDDYAPIDATDIPDKSVDLVTCHIGLHHCPEHRLDDYIHSIHRILRTDGLFIMRDHDVHTPEMGTFVSLVHTVFNLGLNVNWEQNDSEYKSFKTIGEWSEIICKHGFTDSGQRLLQANDPSDNTLVSFIKS